MGSPRFSRLRSPGGFTLIELIVVMVVIVALVAITLPLVQQARNRAMATECASRLRGLGSAILLYANEHGGTLPRSWHSAGAHREPGWAASIAPYLGIQPEAVANDWPAAFNRHFRSPVTESTDPQVFSYGLNVYFELSPEEDYPGNPQTWRTLSRVEAPGRTVLLAQTRPVPFGDHLMAHLWGGLGAARSAVLHDVHQGESNFLFADGSVDRLPLEATFDPSRGVNRWNPALASR